MTTWRLGIDIPQVDFLNRQRCYHHPFWMDFRADINKNSVDKLSLPQRHILKQWPESRVETICQNFHKFLEIQCLWAALSPTKILITVNPQPRARLRLATKNVSGAPSTNDVFFPWGKHNLPLKKCRTYFGTPGYVTYRFAICNIYW